MIGAFFGCVAQASPLVGLQGVHRDRVLRQAFVHERRAIFFAHETRLRGWACRTRTRKCRFKKCYLKCRANSLDFQNILAPETSRLGSREETDMRPTAGSRLSSCPVLAPEPRA